MKIYKLSFICLAVLGVFSENALCATENAPNKKTMTTSKYTLSFEQIKMAAESGDADAQYALGYMFYYGKGGAPKDTALAKTWIGKSATQKQPQAIKALALMSAHEAQTSKNQNAIATNTPMNENQNESKPTQVAVKENNQPKTSEVDKKEKFTKVDTQPKSTEEDNSSSMSSNGQYTLQLLGASNKDQISKMIKEHHLNNKAKIYRTTFKNKDWYVLIYGQYKTKDEAKMAAKKLEDELALKPWVKSYNSVKQFKLIAAS